MHVTAGAFAAVKDQFLASLNARSDLTWQTYDLYVWSGTELFVIIIFGSIPPIKPVFNKLFPSMRSPNNTYTFPYAQGPAYRMRYLPSGSGAGRGSDTEGVAFQGRAF